MRSIQPGLGEGPADFLDHTDRLKALHSVLNQKFPRRQQSYSAWWDALDFSQRRERLAINSKHMPVSATNHVSVTTGEDVSVAELFPFLNVHDLSQSASVRGSLPWCTSLYASEAWGDLYLRLQKEALSKLSHEQLANPDIYYSTITKNLYRVTPKGFGSDNFRNQVENGWMVQTDALQHVTNYITSTFGLIFGYFDAYMTDVLGKETQLKALMGCEVCEAPTQPDGKTLMSCSRCRNALFCGKACQLEGWKTHKTSCKKGSSSMDKG